MRKIKKIRITEEKVSYPIILTFEFERIEAGTVIARCKEFGLDCSNITYKDARKELTEIVIYHIETLLYKG